MKLPKQISKYCPSCKAHQAHKIVLERTKPRPLTQKHALRWGVRHFAHVSSGYGGSPRPIIHSKAKVTKKANMRFQCSKCGKSHFKQHPRRIK
ncbi:MAG TPA: 50S ribosomal protein L44e, partial [Candidatus Nanoarchaeia archaeon]|nr:50S ribosomal protein L44e [Candidatus Nanoarchaeia archaeon]